MKHKKSLVGVVLIAILSIVAVYNPYTEAYIAKLKSDAIVVNKKVDGLYEEIERAAEQYGTPPENAKIDRVWKAMPGYNGIKVDVASSYKRMKREKKFDERKLVFIQVPPDIHLNDLPPSPVYRGHPDKPMVSLMINVAWGNEYLPQMLKTLQKHNVQATFFLEGRWVKENPDLAKMIAENGHELGNHSYSHPNMKTLGKNKATEEIVKTNDIIEATTSKKAAWFGPPSGSYSEETVQIAHEHNLRTVMWTVDTIDWQKPSPDVLLHRVLSKVHSGALILMHPTDPTAKALDQLITELKSKSLRIGTVTKLVDEERIIKLNHSSVYIDRKE